MHQHDGLSGLLFAFVMEKRLHFCLIFNEAVCPLLLFAVGGGLESQGLLDKTKFLEVFEGLSGASLSRFDFEFAALVFQCSQDFLIERL